MNIDGRPVFRPWKGCCVFVAALCVAALFCQQAYAQPGGSAERLDDAFFPRLADFQKPPRHPKWHEANLAAVLPGWKRFEGAEEWLRAHAEASQAERGKFDQFLAAKQAQPASLPLGERDRLFQEFLQWNKAHERR